MNPDDRLHQLIAAYHIGEISDLEFAELEAILEKSEAARELFHTTCRIDTSLRQETENPNRNQPPEQAPFPFQPIFRSKITWAAAAAALVIAGFWLTNQAPREKIIAQLVSAENASWESSLPTEPGSKLTRGYLKLTKGIATIKFRSGAEMMLEAPAKVTIKGPMKAKLVSGSAVVNVPESAIGFVLETPDGRAIDYGTAFAVSVAGRDQQSAFEVIDGEIAVVDPESGKEVRLLRKQSAVISGTRLTTFDGPLPLKETQPKVEPLRIGTKGKSTSLIRNNKLKWTHPDYLLARNTNNGSNFDRRALFSFDLSEIDFNQVKSVKLRLNQVAYGGGFATRLPATNTFGIYGLTNQEKAGWNFPLTWEQGPSSADGKLLGTFDIPRSRLDGSYGIDSKELLEYLRSHQSQSVTLILERLTGQIEGNVKGRIHAFASDSHPEVSGPILEFQMDSIVLNQ